MSKGDGEKKVAKSGRNNSRVVQEFADFLLIS